MNVVELQPPQQRQYKVFFTSIMEINKKYFPSVMKENDKIYFSYLEGVVCSVDELCCMQITNKPEKYEFRIATSHPKYTNMLIEEIIKYHNILNIKLEFSKSIKTTSTVSFVLQKNIN